MINTISAKTLSDNAVIELLKKNRNGSDSPVVTMVLPMERKGAETRKNSIVFKNAVGVAKERLAKLHTESEKMLESLDSLEGLENPTAEFWQHQEEGLILVTDDSGFSSASAYSLPFSVEPFVELSPHPYLLPLLHLTGSQQIYVLVLDLSEIRLYRSNRWQCERVDLTGVPTSLDEAMKYDDPEKSLQQRRVSSSNLQGPGGGNVAFHGHGVTGDETRNKRIQKFFELVSSGLPANFHDRESPLLICGPETAVAKFRETNHYPHVVNDTLDFNPSSIPESQLAETIKNWIASRDARFRSDALAELNAQLAKRNASTGLREIGQSLTEGRVDHLYVREGTRLFGHTYPDGRYSDPAGTRRNLDEDELIATAVSIAAETGSKIHYVPANKPLPNNSPLAAIFRF